MDYVHLLSIVIKGLYCTMHNSKYIVVINDGPMTEIRRLNVEPLFIDVISTLQSLSMMDRMTN